MRRKERYIWKGALIGFGAFSALDILIQYIELKRRNYPFWENYDGWKTLRQGGNGLILGGMTGYLVYRIQDDQQRHSPFCPENHLHQVLNDNSIGCDPQLIKKAKQILSDLKECLVCEFDSCLAGKPVDFGSIPKKTAIGGSSDFDLLVPFKKGIATMENLYFFLYNYLEKKYTSEDFEVRKQRHSIGLTFDDGRLSIHFDIVPARERNTYGETGDLTIRRGKSRFWETHTHLKTNIWKKRKAVVNRPEVRRVIRLVKIYKRDVGLNLNSTALQNLVLEAFDRNKGYVSSSLYKNFILSIEYIASNIQFRKKLKDVANGNINLLEGISEMDRLAISSQMFSDLEKIDKNPRYLKEIFEL